MPPNPPNPTPGQAVGPGKQWFIRVFLFWKRSWLTAWQNEHTIQSNGYQVMIDLDMIQ